MKLVKPLIKKIEIFVYKCIVMQYTGLLDEIVNSVEKYIDKENIGILIKTNYDTYKFCIHKFESCCEIFGVTLYDDSGNYILSTNKEDTKNDVNVQGYFLKEINYCYTRSKSGIDGL